MNNFGRRRKPPLMVNRIQYEKFKEADYKCEYLVINEKLGDIEYINNTSFKDNPDFVIYKNKEHND